MAGLPPIDQSLLPADVRHGNSSDKKTYTAALGFERTLVNELAKTMADTAKPSDDQDTDTATQTYMDMLPDQLTDSVMQNGGIGIARGFYDAMKERGQ